jgi:hypothetical protein
MAGVFLAGARFSIQRLHAHARHDRAHMWTPDHEPLTVELVPQHTHAHKQVLQV